MDQQEADQREVAMEQAEQEGNSSAAVVRTPAPAPADAEAEVEAEQEEDSPADVKNAFQAVEPCEPPPGMFEFPWQKCRGGLGVPAGSAAAELRDVFFRSLVDGRVVAVGVPGDRLLPAPRKRELFEDLEAWLATAGDGEVDPVWRSVLEGPKPAA